VKAVNAASRRGCELGPARTGSTPRGPGGSPATLNPAAQGHRFRLCPNQTPLGVWDDMLDVGTRSAYVASWHAARHMTRRKAGLIVNVSSSGAVEHRWHVAYGVGKAALDRLTADTALELRAHGVAVVSVWPGLVLTERTEAARKHLPQLDFASAESQRFTGRAVAALAADPEVMSRSGKAFASRDLAEAYGFRDLDGRLPAGPIHEP